MPHNSKMNDLGYKDKGCAEVDKDKMRYPHLSLRSDKIPEVKDWKNGGKYYLKILIEQKRSGEAYDNENVIEGDFDILKAAVISSAVSEKEYKGMSDDDKDKADEDEVMGKK